MKRIAILFSLVFLLSGCGNSQEEQNRIMEKSWNESQGNPKVIDCDSSGESFSDLGNGYLGVQINCKLRVSVENGVLYEIVNGHLFHWITNGSGRDAFEERIMQFALGLLDSNVGDMIEVNSTQDKSAISRTLNLQFAIWDEKQKAWLGTSNKLKFRIPADKDLLKLEEIRLKAEKDSQTASDNQYAEEQLARNSYDEGYAFIWESSADFLLTMPGLATSFDIKGNPIKREMTEFCESLYSDTLIARGHLSSSKESSRREWNKGCFKAAMKITLSDLNAGKD
jgi:hypothetical protein